jgi:hypothetical protein
LYWNSLKLLFFSGTINIPENADTKKIIVAEIINGLKNLLKEIPELRIAVISEFDDNLEVNHITDKKTNIGNKKYP